MRFHLLIVVLNFCVVSIMFRKSFCANEFKTTPRALFHQIQFI